MMTITLDGTPSYRPGETITGELTWELGFPVTVLALRLVWNTSGRASEHVQVSLEQLLGAQPNTGRRRFELATPESPYSCDGRLVSVEWAVEAVVNDGAESARAVFVCSPTGSTLELTSVGDDAEPARASV